MNPSFSGEFLGKNPIKQYKITMATGHWVPRSLKPDRANKLLLECKDATTVPFNNKENYRYFNNRRTNIVCVLQMEL